LKTIKITLLPGKYYNAQMDSVAFAAHKSYMDEGHRRGVLNQLNDYFYWTFIGNRHHITAINTHLTAAFYDRAAFQTELDTLRSRQNIVTQNVPVVRGALNKFSRGRVDITPFTKSLSVCTDRIRVLEERLGQIESYLAATSRIYQQAELSLGRAQRELRRLEMANRCLTTGSPTLPTWGEVDLQMVK